MTTLCGVYDPRRRARDGDHGLSEMAGALGAESPGEISIRRSGVVEMALVAGERDAAFPPSREPYSSGDVLLAWDGRLDNRREIETLVGTGRCDLADAELVVRAYESVGRSAFGRLIGDFSLALWDARAERLILARDAMAGRPLFYRHDGRCWMWASAIRPLLEGVDESEIDEEWIAGYLLRMQPVGRTPFRAVSQVPAGHLVQLGYEDPQISAVWDFGSLREIRYTKDSEYEEHFRHLFFEAVRSRMRTRGAPVCAELSGGLDSSSVVCVADHLSRTEDLEVPKLFTYSIVFDRSATSDERGYIQAVERRIGRKGFHLREDDHPMLAPGFDQPWTEVPNFLQTLRAPHVRAGSLLSRRGCRVVLTGLGGDQLMWQDAEAPFHLADLVMRGRPWEAVRQLGQWRRRTAITRYPLPLPQLALRGVFRPILDSLRGRSVPPADFSKLPYLPPASHARMDRIWRDNHPRIRGVRPSVLPVIESLRLLRGHISWFYHFEQLGLQMTHPFLHRPLVEYCLAIPNDQMVRVDETRSLQRRALRDLLPPEVARRQTKVGPDEAVLRGLRREQASIEHLLKDSRVCGRGLADPAPTRRAFERAMGGYAPYNMDLLRFLEVEIWLRSVENGRPSRTGTTAEAA